MHAIAGKLDEDFVAAGNETTRTAGTAGAGKTVPLMSSLLDTNAVIALLNDDASKLAQRV